MFARSRALVVIACCVSVTALVVMIRRERLRQSFRRGSI
jgi:hypothetical protein